MLVDEATGAAGPEFVVSADGRMNPDSPEWVVFDGTQFVVVYFTTNAQGGVDYWLRRVSTTGQVIDSTALPLALGQLSMGAMPSLVSHFGNTYIFWTDSDYSNYIGYVRGQVFRATGSFVFSQPVNVTQSVGAGIRVRGVWDESTNSVFLAWFDTTPVFNPEVPVLAYSVLITGHVDDNLQLVEPTPMQLGEVMVYPELEIAAHQGAIVISVGGHPLYPPYEVWFRTPEQSWTSIKNNLGPVGSVWCQETESGLVLFDAEPNSSLKIQRRSLAQDGSLGVGTEIPHSNNGTFTPLRQWLFNSGTGYLWVASSDVGQNQNAATYQRLSSELEPIDPLPIVYSNNYVVQKNPSLVAGQDGYLIVWEEDRNGTLNPSDSPIYALRLDEQGHALGSPIELPATGVVSHNPKVVFDGTYYLVAWTEEDAGVHFARLGSQGDILDNVSIAVLPGKKVSAVAFDADSFVVIGQDPSTGAPGLARVEADGTVSAELDLDIDYDSNTKVFAKGGYGDTLITYTYGLDPYGRRIRYDNTWVDDSPLPLSDPQLQNALSSAPHAEYVGAEYFVTIKSPLAPVWYEVTIINQWGISLPPGWPILEGPVAPAPRHPDIVFDGNHAWLSYFYHNTNENEIQWFVVGYDGLGWGAQVPETATITSSEQQYNLALNYGNIPYTTVSDGNGHLLAAYLVQENKDFDASQIYLRRITTSTLLPLGTSCATGTECDSGFCIDEVCCDMDCGTVDSDCMACSVAKGSLVDGHCSAVRVDMGYVCALASNPCMIPHVCEGGFECPTDEVPEDDGFECAPVDQCHQGPSTCVSGVCTPANLIDCPPPGECEESNCDPSTGCGTQVSADGTLCTNGTCLAGQCITGGSGGTGGVGGSGATGGSSGSAGIGAGGAGGGGGTAQAGQAGQAGQSGQAGISGAAGSGGQAATGAVATEGSSGEDGGCGCRTVQTQHRATGGAVGLLIALGSLRRRRTANTTRNS